MDAPTTSLATAARLLDGDLRRVSAVTRWSHRRPTGYVASAPLVISLVAVLTVESCLADPSGRSFPAVICGSMRTDSEVFPPQIENRGH